MSSRSYRGVPFVRRTGMWLFSTMIRCVTQTRVYDTTSGMKVMSRAAVDALLTVPFVDFHAEAIAYLLRSGMTVGEFPITVEQRRYGTSMYGIRDAISYGLRVLALLFRFTVASSSPQVARK